MNAKNLRMVTSLLATMLAGGVLPVTAQSTETFTDAVNLVNAHSKLVVLTASNGGKVAVWPAMQGRVLTSALKPDGRSFGWVNQDLVASGTVQQHINAVGGEDRLWLGPEGGQFSIFFAPGVPFDLAHWYTPPSLDTEAFDVTSQSEHSISLSKSITLTNYSGTRFEVRIDRKVHMLDEAEVWRSLGVPAANGVQLVAFQSDNRMTNVSSKPMSKNTGVLSLWVLGQFNAAPRASIVLPFHEGPEATLGSVVKTDYFGTVPRDRIQVGTAAVLFKADSNFRSKLGINPKRSEGKIGSYDPDHHLLTIVQYNQQPAADYVNSAWAIQDKPYKGDVANCYNDGPPSPGAPQLGHFYELESSSPAAALPPNGSVSHFQRTIHLVGDEQALDAIASRVLGIRLNEIAAFAAH